MSRLEGLQKLKGLWFIGAGVLLLSAWIAIFVYVASILVGVNARHFYITFLIGIYNAFSSIINTNPHYYAYNLWPISGFALIGIGLYRLIRSLRESRQQQ